jgi:hypothetical protein
MAVDAIVAFYSGGPDSAGRTLEAILAYDDDRLEAIHDYVQWLFPTRQPSGVNPFAPLVTAETVRAFQQDLVLRDRLRQSFVRMLRFYGLRWLDGRVEINRQAFPARARVWLTPGNHNHLRLTRILECLSTLGLRTEALALQRCLIDDVAAGPGKHRITAQTLDFWLRTISARTE